MDSKHPQAQSRRCPALRKTYAPRPAADIGFCAACSAGAGRDGFPVTMRLVLGPPEGEMTRSGIEPPLQTEVVGLPQLAVRAGWGHSLGGHLRLGYVAPSHLRPRYCSTRVHGSRAARDTLSGSGRSSASSRALAWVGEWAMDGIWRRGIWLRIDARWGQATCRTGTTTSASSSRQSLKLHEGATFGWPTPVPLRAVPVVVVHCTPLLGVNEPERGISSNREGAGALRRSEIRPVIFMQPALPRGTTITICRQF